MIYVEILLLDWYLDQTVQTTIFINVEIKIIGSVLVNDFWTPPPLLLSILYMDLKCKRILNVRHVAPALGPLACPSRSARPRKCLN